MALKSQRIEDGELDIWIGSDRKQKSTDPSELELLFFETSPNKQHSVSCSCCSSSDSFDLNIEPVVRDNHNNSVAAAPADITTSNCYSISTYQEIDIGISLHTQSQTLDGPLDVDANSIYVLKWWNNSIVEDQVVTSTVKEEEQSFEEAKANTCKVEFAEDVSELKKEDPFPIVKEEVREGKRVKVFECSACNREFRHQYTLQRHLPTHTDQRNFVCKDCGKAFRQLSTLNQHRVIHSLDRPFQCELCQKTFNRVSTLISHRKTHSKVKPFQCIFCFKGFHQKGNLRNHINTHTNERPYRCSICQKGFNQMSNLTCHKQKAHPDVKVIWECKKCSSTFPKRSELRAHQLRHQEVDFITISNIHQSTESIMAGIRNANKPFAPRTGAHPQPAPMPSVSSASAPILTTGIVIPAIQTDAMKKVCENKEVPFAVLHFLHCDPLLVRVLQYQNQSLLRPANKLDLAEVQSSSGPKKPTISVPIVAAVYQTLDHTGATSYTVMPPRNKFNTDLQKLTMYDQHTVFNMKASNPMPGTKRRRPPAKVVGPPNHSRDPEPAKKPALAVETKKPPTLPKPLIMNSPNPVVVQPVQPIPTTLAHEDTDISEAILMFATGSFLSPRRKQKTAIKDEELTSPSSTITSSSSTTPDSDDVFGSSFANFVTALQSDGHTADLEKIKEFFCANGLIGADADGECGLP